MKEVNKSKDIVIPLQNMKIRDESTEKREIRASKKEDAFSPETLDKTPSVQRVCEMDTGPNDGSESHALASSSKNASNDERSGNTRSRSRSLKYSRRRKYGNDRKSNSEHDSDYSKKRGSRPSKRSDNFKDDIKRKSNFLERGDDRSPELEESNLESSRSKEGSRLKHRSSRHDYYRSSKSHKFDGLERDDSQSPVHEERELKYSSTKRHSKEKDERHKYHRSGKHHKLSSLERGDSQSPVRENRKSEYSHRRGYSKEDDEVELRPSRHDYHRGKHIHHEAEVLERGDSRSQAHEEQKSKYLSNRRSNEKGERYSHHSSGKQDKFCLMEQEDSRSPVLEKRKSEYSHRKGHFEEELELGLRPSRHNYHHSERYKLGGSERGDNRSTAREEYKSKYSLREELFLEADEQKHGPREYNYYHTGRHCKLGALERGDSQYPVREERKSKHFHGKELSQEREKLERRSSPYNDSYHSGKYHKPGSSERGNKKSKYSHRKELSREEDER